jgi:hypothetical protein
MEARFPADGSAVSDLFDAATSIKISQRVWKIGYPIYSIDESATKKSKMVKSFAAQYASASARVEGVIVTDDSSHGCQ